MEIAEQFTLTNHESAALVSSGFATATLQQVRETNAGNGAAQDDKLGIPPLFFVEGPQVVPPEHSHPPGEPTSPQGLRELPSGGESPFENRIEQKIESLKAEVLADSYGLKYDAKIVNGRGVYKFYYEGVDGKRVEVASANRLDEAERLLKADRNERVARVETQFGVKVSRDGENQSFGDKNYQMRTPNIQELAALEEGLFKTQPAQYTKDGKPLVFNYGVGKIGEGERPVSFFASDKSGNARIVLQNDQSYDDKVRTVMHEISHNEQQATRAFDNTDDYAKTFGMHRGEEGFFPFKSKTDEWVLEGKDKDEYYKRDWSKENAEKNVWIKTDYDGNPIKGKDGKPIIITNEEAQKRARITPPTLYFPNPIENGADSLTNFRHSEKLRAEILQDSPQLYASLKEMDKRQMDKYYGTNADGTSKYVRLPDGMVAANNEQNRIRIAQFEQPNRIRSSEPRKQNYAPPCCGVSHGSGNS